MTRILIVGCGDVALRVADRLRDRAGLIGLTRNHDDVRRLRAHGVVPLVGDLDDRRTLRRLRTAPFAVLHFAPPPSEGKDDPRTRRLLAALAGARIIPRHFVYISTSGVYGDCAGARVPETRPRRAHTPRARRRVAAEDRLRHFAAHHGIALSVLRVPGIYAPTRLPLERLRHGTPALTPDDDVYTNHIHADDLARICIAALWRGKPQRAYHAVDDTDMLMGEYLDAVARISGLPPPPRISRSEAAQTLSPQRMSFLNESRRLSNRRLKTELRLRLRYPTVLEGLQKA